jgi:hypothetical protein
MTSLKGHCSTTDCVSGQALSVRRPLAEELAAFPEFDAIPKARSKKRLAKLCDGLADLQNGVAEPTRWVAPAGTAACHRVEVLLSVMVRVIINLRVVSAAGGIHE